MKGPNEHDLQNLYRTGIDLSEKVANEVDRFGHRGYTHPESGACPKIGKNISESEQMPKDEYTYLDLEGLAADLEAEGDEIGAKTARECAKQMKLLSQQLNQQR